MEIGRTAVGLLTVGLALMLVAARSDAGHVPSGLGCSVGGQGGPPGFATCETNEDCAPVGGIACTGGGICFCDGGDLSPFCACLATPETAPALSGTGMIALIALLCAVGMAGLWRRTRDQHPAA